MPKYILTLSPVEAKTRALLTHGQDEFIRANLAPPSCVYYEDAVTTFVEGLAAWLNHKLLVVLYVDSRESSYCLGLTDNLGIGIRRISFEVFVEFRDRRRRSATRVRGLGDFSELRKSMLHSENA